MLIAASWRLESNVSVPPKPTDRMLPSIAGKFEVDRTFVSEKEAAPAVGGSSFVEDLKEDVPDG